MAITNNSAAPSSGNSSSEKSGIGVKASLTKNISISLEKFRALAVMYNPWAAFQSYRTKRRENKKVPQKQPPFTLSLCGVFLLLACEFAILIAITVLWVLTTKNNGFADVPDTPSTIKDAQNTHGALLLAFSVLWTSLPAFIVTTLCGANFAATVQALENCQPTIELRKHFNAEPKRCSCDASRCCGILPTCEKAASRSIREKSTAKRTVLLDYGTEWLPVRDTYRAFRNKHFLIGMCMVVKWSFAAIGPLASSVISTRTVLSSTKIEAFSSTFFDDWKNQSSTRPAFESASAILLNSGSPYPWTTAAYSVVPFFAPFDTSGNLTADRGTYSATLDCKPIDIDSLLRVGNITIQAVNGGNNTDFYFTDRGCLIDAWINVSPDPPRYSLTRFATCALEAEQARLLFLAGDYDPSSPYRISNFSLISCIPSFWNSTSRVSVLFDAPLGLSGQITNIITYNSTIHRFWPEFWQMWMTRIPEYRIEDPTQPSDSDDFGRLVYDYAKLKQANGTVDYIQAMNTTFSVIFAAFATTSTYSPLSEHSTFTGTLSRPTNRLFVVFFPALVVTIVTAICFVVTLWIAVYIYLHRFDIREQLDLIFGHAILLEKTEGMSEFIRVVREDMGRQAQVAATARKKKSDSEKDVERAAKNAAENGDLVAFAQRTGSLNGWKCWVENGKLSMERGQVESCAKQPKL